MNAYMHYILNDYDILEDIKSINMKVDKHNERLTDLKDKVTKFKDDVKQGNSGAIGAASLGLA